MEWEIYLIDKTIGNMSVLISNYLNYYFRTKPLLWSRFGKSEFGHYFEYLNLKPNFFKLDFFSKIDFDKPSSFENHSNYHIFRGN